MSAEPAVSIAIRAFRRDSVGVAIASVLGQTHRDLELVVYDDAGDLDDVAASFGDHRVRYVRAAEKLDTAGRYTAAVALCRGAYVGLLDDDDRYEPGFVAHLHAALAADDGAAAAVGRTRWEHRGRLFVPRDDRPPGVQHEVAGAFVELCWSAPPSTALFRRSVLEAGERRHPVPAGVAPDAFVNVRTAAAGGRYVVVDDAIVVRRWHDERLTPAGLAVLDRIVATWERLPIDDPSLEAPRRSTLARILVRRAGYRLIERDAVGARSDLARAREVDAAAWPYRRRALEVAALAPRLGRAALGVWFALPQVRRRRLRPPGC